MEQNKKPVIYAVDNDKNICGAFVEFFSQGPFSIETFTSAQEALKRLEEAPADVIVTDIKMPNIDGFEFIRKLKEKNIKAPIIVMTAYSTIKTAVTAIKDGAFDFISKPFNFEELKGMISEALNARELVSSVLYTGIAGSIRDKGFSIVGKSDKLRVIFEYIDKLSRIDSNVLISGESGTGKELVALAIHYNGIFRNKPFIAINCAAIPENLLESELFGYEKGAFTGAAMRKAGKIEMADSGTLFLDEIGEMSHSLQAKLLRFIEFRVFQRVGGVEDVKVDVRIITATHRILRDEVKCGRFREDLYYRLNVIPINLPPLRERREDIPELIEYYLKKYSAKHGKRFLKISAAEETKMLSYGWPGNIRELENIIERSVALSDSNTEVLEEVMIDAHEAPAAAVPAGCSWDMSLEDMEKAHIEAVLAHVGGVKSKAAEVLGIDRSTLYEKIRKYNLSNL